MSVLEKLKVTDGTVRERGYDPVRLRRKKLAAALQQQIVLLEHALSGVQRPDAEGDGSDVRSASPWWWFDDDGTVRFSIRYGAARLKVKDGKEVIVFPSEADLMKVLPTLRHEVLTGGLDTALAEAAEYLQSRFKPSKPSKG